MYPHMKFQIDTYDNIQVIHHNQKLNQRRRRRQRRRRGGDNSSINFLRKVELKMLIAFKILEIGMQKYTFLERSWTVL